jgi:hypothetical protein
MHMKARIAPPKPYSGGGDRDPDASQIRSNRELSHEYPASTVEELFAAISPIEFNVARD